LTATFGVEVKRMAYFFKDRDVTVGTLTVGGRRRPVFHIVKPHMRRTKKGETAVGMHFSGLKDFEWAGYGIHITVPGRDHLHLAEIDIGMHQTKKTPIKGFVTEAEMGDRIKGWMKEGLGAWQKP
jgi:hypothetical protein